MVRKFLGLFLVLVTALSFNACAEETEPVAGLPPAQEIVDGVIAALDKQKTAQFDMDITMNISGEANGEAVEANIAINNKGTVDIAGRKMSAQITIDTTSTAWGESEQVAEMYLIGDMIYMKVEVPGMGPMWAKSEVPEGYWQEMSQIESQVAILKTAQVRVIGSEPVQGIDCYVLQVTPDMEQLWQIVRQQSQVPQGGVPEVTAESLKDIFRSFSVKQWIAQDTYFLTRAEIKMDIRLTPEAMGYTDEEGLVTMDMAITLLAYNYNQPVSIVLPSEAEEAIEVPQGVIQ